MSFSLFFRLSIISVRDCGDQTSSLNLVISFLFLLCACFQLFNITIFFFLVQGACATDGPFCHFGRAAKQLLLWCWVRTRWDGRFDICHYQVGPSLRVQQPTPSWQMGRITGQFIIGHLFKKIFSRSRNSMVSLCKCYLYLSFDFYRRPVPIVWW